MCLRSTWSSGLPHQQAAEAALISCSRRTPRHAPPAAGSPECGSLLLSVLVPCRTMMQQFTHRHTVHHGTWCNSLRASPAAVALPKAVQLRNCLLAPATSHQYTRHTLLKLLLMLLFVSPSASAAALPHQIKGSNLGIGLGAKVPASTHTGAV